VTDGGVDVYGVVAAAVVFPTLLAAGCHHLLHTDQLAQVLRLHGWSPTLSRPGSVLLALTETTLGAVGATGVVVGAAANPLISLAAAVVFSAYAADAVRVLRWGSQGEGERERAGGWGSQGEGERERAGGWGSQVPCGCGVVDHPVNQWVVVRALAYAGLAGLAALPRPTLAELAPAAAVTAASAALVVGLLLWLLPRTLAIPVGFLSGGAGPPRVSRNQDPRSFTLRP
jgi:hypothetical protein